MDSPSVAQSEALPQPSFLTLIEQAADATSTAIADGSTLMEVEFPPVPLSKLEDSSISAYDLLQANLQLALEYCKRLRPAIGGGEIAIALPDIAERERAREVLGDAEPAAGVRLWALNGGDEEPAPFGFFGSLIKGA